MIPALAAGFVSELREIAKQAALKPSVHLQGQQEDIVRRSRNSPGMIANWGLGSGKTIGSMAVAEDKGGNVLVVVPAALRDNYKKQLAANVEPKRHKAYTIISYEAFRKDPQRWISDIKPTTLIADEFHRLRNPRPREPFEKVRSQVPFMLGLTGSLVNNRPEEIVPLTNLVAGKQVFKSEEDFDRRFIEDKKVSPGLLGRLRGVKPGVREGIQNERVLGKILAPFIHRFSGDEEYKKHLPQVTEGRVEVEMSQRQEEMLKGLQKESPVLDYKIRHNLPPSKSELKDLNAFMTGARQISNNPQAFTVRPTPSPKLEKMFGDIHDMAAKDPRFKAVVYSNFIESGIAPLIDNLKSKGISAEAFTGGLNDKQRGMLVDKFNKGHIRVLGLSPAGGEGLDLKGVKLVQLTEEHWNPERTRQAIGRSARFKSHEALPANERKVQVNRYLAVHPPPGFFARLFGAKRPMSPDEWIDERRREKLQLNQAVVGAIPEYQRKAASVAMMTAFAEELAKLAISKDMVNAAMAEKTAVSMSTVRWAAIKRIYHTLLAKGQSKGITTGPITQSQRILNELVPWKGSATKGTAHSRKREVAKTIQKHFPKEASMTMMTAFDDELRKLAVSGEKIWGAIKKRILSGSGTMEEKLRRIKDVVRRGVPMREVKPHRVVGLKPAPWDPAVQVKTVTTNLDSAHGHVKGIVEDVQREVPRQKLADSTETLSALTGLVSGVSTARNLAGDTAAEISPHGRKTRSESLGRSLAWAGGPAAGIAALALARKFNLTGKAVGALAKKFPHGLVTEPHIEQAFVKAITPAAVGFGGTAAGGLATGAAVGGVQKLRGEPKGWENRKHGAAFLDELQKLAKNISKHQVTDVEGLEEYRTDRRSTSLERPVSKTRASVTGGVLGSIPGGMLGLLLAHHLAKTPTGMAALTASGALAGGGLGVLVGRDMREEHIRDISNAKREVNSKTFKKDTHKKYTKPLHQVLNEHKTEKERLEEELESLRSELDDLQSKTGAAFVDELRKVAISEGKVVNAIFSRAYAGKQVGPTIKNMAKTYMDTTKTMGSPVTREGLKKWIRQVKDTGKV